MRSGPGVEVAAGVCGVGVAPLIAVLVCVDVSRSRCVVVGWKAVRSCAGCKARGGS
jgi:hypothetical protein